MNPLMTQMITVACNHPDLADWRAGHSISLAPVTADQVQHVLAGGKDTAIDFASIIKIAKEVCALMGDICPLINNL